MLSNGSGGREPAGATPPAEKVNPPIYQPPAETLRKRARRTAATHPLPPQPENALSIQEVSGNTVRVLIPPPEVKRMWRFLIPGLLLPAGLVAFVLIKHIAAGNVRVDSLGPVLTLAVFCIVMPLAVMAAVTLHVAVSTTRVEVSPRGLVISRRRLWGWKKEEIDAEKILDILNRGVSGGRVPEINVVTRNGVTQFGRHLPEEEISWLAGVLRGVLSSSA